MSKGRFIGIALEGVLSRFVLRPRRLLPILILEWLERHHPVILLLGPESTK